MAVSEVQLIFDTGLHRFLALSQADGYTARMDRGRPQAETVRDYWLENESGGMWRTVHSEAGNDQRRRVHCRAGGGARGAAWLVVVTATNGPAHARICEVRVYS